jgi:hypothetical protein
MSNTNIPKTAALNRLIKYANLDNVQIVNAKRGIYSGSEPKLIHKKDDVLGLSSLGTPIYTDLTLMGCTYTDNITGKPVTLDNDKFRTGGSRTPVKGNDSGIGEAFYMNLETVLITVQQPIRVIKTEIQGRNGTVKEYIGADDAKITINGIITGFNGVYPKDEVARLKRWLDAPVSKDIVAWWLGNLGVNKIVVENYSIPQVQGGYSYQMFSIDAISDLPVELRITSGNV